jgi:tRNA dimethylallyltransferase
MKNKKLLVICGPTATGKTKLALAMAKIFDGELVSCDSRQVYQGMDIITGKDLVSKETIERLRLRVSHNGTNYLLVPYKFHDVSLWMCDVVLPNQEFSVSHYQSLAGAVVQDIQKNNKLPIVVGGTGLYIRSILTPLETASVAPDMHLRKDLAQASLEELQRKLQDFDFETFKNLNESDRKNPRRLIRKIEICLSQKKLLKNDMKTDFDLLLIGLTTSLGKIYERIDSRVDKRMKSGALDEVKKMQTLYGFDVPSMTGLGYREWREYFMKPSDKSNLNACVERWKYDEHAYARRQMTWFRKEKDIQWFDIEDPQYEKNIESLVSKWYTEEKNSVIASSA